MLPKEIVLQNISRQLFSLFAMLKSSQWHDLLIVTKLSPSNITAYDKKNTQIQLVRIPTCEKKLVIIDSYRGKIYKK